MVRQLLLLAISSGLWFDFYGQSIQKIERKAERTFYDEDFVHALPLYNQILSLEPEHKTAQYRAELCSLLIQDFRNKPLDTILSYANTRGRTDKFYNYWLGRIYLARYRQDEAVAAWSAFLDLKVYKSKLIIDETKEFINIAEKSKGFYENPAQYFVKRLEAVNTAQTELSPTYLPEVNQLVFASRNSVNHRLQLSTTVKSNEWQSPRRLEAGGKLNDTNIDVDYHPSGKLLIKNGNKEIISLVYQGGAWGSPKSYFKLPGRKPKSHFTISDQEDRIIFSQLDISGNLDLYEIVKIEGKWSKPEFILNLNSNLNEDSPFLSSDGKTLYFSSEGHNAMGGFDIMVSFHDGNEWSAPRNMGYPINTLDNELHFSISEDGKSGYLASDRLGSEGYDLYTFSEIRLKNIEGIIVDNNTNLEVPGLRLEFLPDQFSDRYYSTTGQNGAFQTKIMSSGTYQLKIFDGEELVMQETFNLSGEESEEIITRNLRVNLSEERSLSLAQSLTTNENAQFNESGYSPLNFIANKFRPGNKVILKNLYFKSGSSQLEKGSDRVLTILEQLLVDNPTLQLEIAGHTDNLGDENYNMWLSNRRAHYIRKMLTDSGIAPERLLARGYGEYKPIASNDDEVDGRALNRRIELLVIE